MNRPKILLVDDSITILTIMTNTLQKVGYEVDVAVEGNEALYKIAMLRPHFLVLDVILPGVNGYSICRQIRAQDPQHILPILFISTKNTPLERNYGLSLGADYYLAKPFTQDTLLQTVWNLLPVHLRPFQTSPLQSPLQTRPLPSLDTNLANLIPRRRSDPSLLTTRNPFSKTPRMDYPTHLLYLSMDGQKTVKTLSEATGFDMQKITELLKTLIEQKYVELYDPEERKIVQSLSDYL